MNTESPLLIIANTPSANTLKLAQAVESGAQDIEEIHTRRLLPLAATAEDILSARAVIIGTTENFGAMSGQIKDFFERIYYPCLDKTNALPCALYVRAGKDGTCTLRGVQSIIGGLRWRQMQPPLLMRGDYQDSFIGDCKNLGATIAAGLSVGIF